MDELQPFHLFVLFEPEFSKCQRVEGNLNYFYDVWMASSQKRTLDFAPSLSSCLSHIHTTPPSASQSVFSVCNIIYFHGFSYLNTNASHIYISRPELFPEYQPQISSLSWDIFAWDHRHLPQTTILMFSTLQNQPSFLFCYLITCNGSGS